MQRFSAQPAGRILSLYSGVIGGKLNTPPPVIMPEMDRSGYSLSEADDCADLAFSFKYLTFNKKIRRRFWRFVESARLSEATGIEFLPRSRISKSSSFISFSRLPRANAWIDPRVRLLAERSGFIQS